MILADSSALIEYYRPSGDPIARATVAEAVEAREYLTKALTELGLEVYPSAANFVLVAAPHNDAMAYSRELAAAGIGVRPFPGLPHAGDCVRVTAAPIPWIDRLVARTKKMVGR